MRVPDDFLKIVLFLGYTDNEKRHVVGTAFMLSVPNPNKPDWGYVYAVTAGHIAERLQNRPFWARVNYKDGSAGYITFESRQWTFHSEYPRVDVAIADLSFPDDADFKFISSEMILQNGALETNRLGLGDEVSFPGLFGPAIGQAVVA